MGCGKVRFYVKLRRTPAGCKPVAMDTKPAGSGQKSEILTYRYFGKPSLVLSAVSDARAIE